MFRCVCRHVFVGVCLYGVGVCVVVCVGMCGGACVCIGMCVQVCMCV